MNSEHAKWSVKSLVRLVGDAGVRVRGQVAEINTASDGQSVGFGAFEVEKQFRQLG